MRVPISDLKAHLSEHLRRVQDGAEIDVLDRARPIARIVPVRRDDDGVEIVPAARPFATVRATRRERARTTMTSLRALQLDRGTR